MTASAASAGSVKAPARGPARTGLANQIPRNALALLMMAQLAVLLPHMLYQPVGIVAVALFCGFWRTQVYRGRWGYPGALVKGTLVMLSIAGVAVSGVPGFSLEAATTLLLLAFALKLLEMKTRRDAYLVIFLSYFVIATEFLFDQSLLVAVYEVAATVLVTAALIGLNQMHSAVRPAVTVKIAATLIAQALPLTIVLFLFFPRVAPLWSMPLPNAAKTGISDQMTPGDVARLSQSDELAFRVQFEGAPPRYSDLYWRGLVYTGYEQGTWSVPPRELDPLVLQQRSNQVGRVLRMTEARAVAAGVQPLRYTVMLEPTARHWLFALDVALSDQSEVLASPHFALEARDPVVVVKRYDVRSYPDLPTDLPQLSRRAELAARAPFAEQSPRVREFARQLFASSDADPQQFVAAFNRHVREQPFRYTLEPPVLTSSNRMDEFWFATQAGFCSHYAGALVFMLRELQIPARVVGGYQGGTINPGTGHVEVRQFDAHAWVEYWIPEAGWVRADPTAAVAPQRVERGLGAALSADEFGDLSLFAAARLGEGSLLSAALEFADSLEHRWNMWVVGFDDNQQRGLLQELLGELSPARIGLAMLAGGVLSLGLVSALLFWRQRPRRREALIRAFQALAQAGAAAGSARSPEESPGAYLARLASERDLPAPVFQPVIAALSARMYNPDSAAAGSDAALIRALQRLRLRIVLGARKPSVIGGQA
ncbi:MAG: transglutaminaseTgpA domain-containing protein [Pseudomonadales bacterium]